MRRFWAVVLAVFLLCGCGAEDRDGFQVRTAEEPMEFSHFSAGAAENGEEVLAILEGALAEYPEGFLEQLGSVEVVIVGELTGQREYSHGDYAGFTQRKDDGWLMVLGSGCTSGTVHHEIGHILDGILTEAGVLTEAEWMEFCPGGFKYGQTDGAEDFFAEPYAMVSIREDRAATFEAAVMGGEGAFADSPALWLKLEYFARAVREHFDTEGWPARTVWELALG